MEGLVHSGCVLWKSCVCGASDALFTTDASRVTTYSDRVTGAAFTLCVQCESYMPSRT